MQNKILASNPIKTATPPTTAPTVTPVDERVGLFSSASVVEEAVGRVPPELVMVEELDWVELSVRCAVDVTGDEMLVVIALFKTDADAEEVVDAVLVLDVKGGETVFEWVDAELTDGVDVVGGGFVVVGG